MDQLIEDQSPSLQKATNDAKQPFQSNQRKLNTMCLDRGQNQVQDSNYLNKMTTKLLQLEALWIQKETEFSLIFSQQKECLLERSQTITRLQQENLELKRQIKESNELQVNHKKCLKEIVSHIKEKKSQSGNYKHELKEILGFIMKVIKQSNKSHSKSEKSIERVSPIEQVRENRITVSTEDTSCPQRKDKEPCFEERKTRLNYRSEKMITFNTSGGNEELFIRQSCENELTPNKGNQKIVAGSNIEAESEFLKAFQCQRQKKGFNHELDYSLSSSLISEEESSSNSDEHRKQIKTEKKGRMDYLKIQPCTLELNHLNTAHKTKMLDREANPETKCNSFIDQPSSYMQSMAHNSNENFYPLRESRNRKQTANENMDKMNFENVILREYVLVLDKQKSQTKTQNLMGKFKQQNNSLLSKLRGKKSIF